jgi:hypothetical protein
LFNSSHGETKNEILYNLYYKLLGNGLNFFLFFLFCFSVLFTLVAILRVYFDMSLLSKVTRCMRAIAPLELAETSWDNVGVLVGK